MIRCATSFRALRCDRSGLTVGDLGRCGAVTCVQVGKDENAESILVGVLAKDLRLGDQVRLFPEPYGWATVVKLQEHSNHGGVHLQRLYLHTADFSYTGGLMNYVGFETVIVHPDDRREFLATAYSRKRSEAFAKSEQ